MFDRATLPRVQMPNRDGFIPESEFIYFTTPH
jgi:hypothetical protein